MQVYKQIVGDITIYTCEIKDKDNTIIAQSLSAQTAVFLAEQEYLQGEKYGY